MNFYIDVDGTIITKDHKEAENLNRFLRALINSGDLYWLTTHCRYDNADSVFSYLKPILSDDNYLLIRKIKPTNWQTLKTEAIDFSQPFIWFDDFLLEAEKIILRENDCFKNWTPINLYNNPDILNSITKASSQNALFFNEIFTGLLG